MKTLNLRQIILIVFSVLIILTCGTLFSITTFQSNQILLTQNNESLLKLAQQSARTIDIQLQSRLILLETLANNPILRGKYGDRVSTMPEKLSLLSGECQHLEQLGIKRLGIINNQGIIHYPDGKTLYLGDREHVKKVLKGENIITDILLSRYAQHLIFSYLVPIRDYQTGSIIGALVAASDAVKLNEFTQFHNENTLATAYIIDHNGTIIAHKNFSLVSSKRSHTELYDTSFSPIARAMEKGQTGYQTFTQNNHKLTIAYAPISTTHWSIGFIVPNHDTSQKANHFAYSMIIVFLVITIVALVLAFLFADRISRRHIHLKEVLEKNKNHFETIFNNNAAGIVMTDSQCTILSINQRLCEIFGYTKEELLHHNCAVIHCNQGSFESFKELYSHAIERTSHVTLEYQFKHKKGHYLWCEFFGKSLVLEDGTQGILWSVIDIDARKYAEEESFRLSQAMAQSPVSMLITDLNTNILYANPILLRNTGYALEDIYGKSAHILTSEKTPQSTLDTMWSYLNEGRNWKGELIYQNKDGKEYIVDVTIAPIYSVNGNIINYLTITEDITEKKYAQERINYLANYDHLTGVANRMQLANHFNHLLTIAKRNQESLAVLFLDLDAFKNVNDTYGHTVGDILLTMIAKRLQSLMREQDIIARTGGDEFVILLPNTPKTGAQKVVEKILLTISKPYEIQQTTLTMSLSIGISIFPDDGSTMDTLIQNADHAMYQSKSLGRNTFNFFQ